uniref:Uncharacterized protein n=2 Tax=root TaxID=1 RepID=S0DJ83_9VIRU|nr:conserved hypothetical protein [Cotesia sesamiae Kitale bracovirus]
MMFSSKLQLVFLVAILGTSYGARNGYSYSQLDGPFGYSSPQLNGLQINLHQTPNGPLECFCQPHRGSGYPSSQPKVGSGYPYSQIDSSSGYSRSQLNGGIGFGYPYPQSS